MKKRSNEFIHDSESRVSDGLCNKILVTVDLYEASKNREIEDCCFNEADASLFDETTQEHIELSSLPKNEQESILKRSETIFDELIYDEWFEHKLSKAEYMRDSFEDR